MSALPITKLVTLVPLSGGCSNCGIYFAVPSDFDAKRRDDGQTFHCPNGHSLHYGDTKERRLERQLAAITKDVEQERIWKDSYRKQRDSAEEEARKQYRTKKQVLGKLRATKARVKNGVCPCCQRSFVQLARHMETQHPGYASAVDTAVDERDAS